MNHFLLLLFTFILSYSFLLNGEENVCSPSTKKDSDGKCISLTNHDVLKAMKFLSSHVSLDDKISTTTSTSVNRNGFFITESLSPSNRFCKKSITVQDITVCEDIIDYNNCVIWSAISTNMCDHYGSIEFEKYWSTLGCKVTIFHLYIYIKGNVCNTPSGVLAEYPNINIIRGDMWGEKCFNCVYKMMRVESIKRKHKKIDILKVQRRAGVAEDFDGVQFTVLSDLYLHARDIFNTVKQVVYTVSYTTETLVDLVGRESEHAWNIWASQQLLQYYVPFQSVTEKGPSKLQPIQFSHLLQQAKVDYANCFYHQSLIKLDPTKESDKVFIVEIDSAVLAWRPNPPDPPLYAKVPIYCLSPPTKKDDEIMQEWIKAEMNVRCHATRLAVPCIRTKQYDAIIPCPQELMNNLAEDYAAMKGWCNFSSPDANIQSLTKVDKAAYQQFRKPFLKDKKRLAFFFTVYADAPFVKRLFNLLYNEDHYYLFHIDPAGSTTEFELSIRQLSLNRTNVHFAKDIQIVYGASTATILLTKTMAWFDKYATGWDYFVPLTGSDYPLIPLHMIEKIFNYQNPPMPFVMAWTPGTSTHIFRLQKTHPVFENDPYLISSVKNTELERGRPLGAVVSEFRSMNFGPPLFCSGKSSFYHLDNRQNKSGELFDTQWLFPRDVFPGRGKAYAEENPVFATPSFDGGWRIWKKSDPATSGAYDRLSVDYIVNSLEGKKYWHFFKHMLLGSEEHYYVSLLYNWPRTKSFVQTLSAQIVWNTWELGLWEQSAGFQTHTHFLTLDEWDILVGFSMRGMMFARKFSTKKTAALLDKIDATFLYNKSSNAGQYWPGFFEVDITSPGKIWVAAYRRNQSMKAGTKTKKSAVMKIKKSLAVEDSIVKF